MFRTRAPNIHLGRNIRSQGSTNWSTPPSIKRGHTPTMGGEQSKPNPYVADFRTAAAQNAQQLYSAKAPDSIHAKSHMLGDAFMIQKVKAIEGYERHVSVVTGGISGMGMQAAGRSAYTADGPVEEAQKRAHAAYAQQLLPQRLEVLEQPHVPGDAWAIRMAQSTPFNATESRNRFDLMRAPDTIASSKLDNVGHAGIDAQQVAESIKAKGFTPGAVKREWVGIKGTVNLGDYMLKESLKFTQARTPNRKGDAQGIKPNLPTGGERLECEQVRVRQVIKDANRMQELPAPNYGGDSYMVKHAEQAQAFIASNFKIHEPNLPAPPDEMAA